MTKKAPNSANDMIISALVDSKVKDLVNFVVSKQIPEVRRKTREVFVGIRQIITTEKLPMDAWDSHGGRFEATCKDIEIYRTEYYDAVTIGEAEEEIIDLNDLQKEPLPENFQNFPEKIQQEAGVRRSLIILCLARLEGDSEISEETKKKVQEIMEKMSILPYENPPQEESQQLINQLGQDTLGYYQAVQEFYKFAEGFRIGNQEIIEQNSYPHKICASLLPTPGSVVFINKYPFGIVDKKEAFDLAVVQENGTVFTKKSDPKIYCNIKVQWVNEKGEIVISPLQPYRSEVPGEKVDKQTISATSIEMINQALDKKVKAGDDEKAKPFLRAKRRGVKYANLSPEKKAWSEEKLLKEEWQEFSEKVAEEFGMPVARIFVKNRKSTTSSVFISIDGWSEDTNEDDDLIDKINLVPEGRNFPAERFPAGQKALFHCQTYESDEEAPLTAYNVEEYGNRLQYDLDLYVPENLPEGAYVIVETEDEDKIFLEFVAIPYQNDSKIIIPDEIQIFDEEGNEILEESGQAELEPISTRFEFIGNRYFQCTNEVDGKKCKGKVRLTKGEMKQKETITKKCPQCNGEETFNPKARQEERK